MDRVDPVGVAEWVRTERITSFGAVPTIVHGLLTHPDVHEEDLVTLTQPEVGGADCPEEFRALYRERFGTEVALGYGMTEAPTAVTLERPEGPHLPGGAGVALPHVRITVRDEAGRELGAEEIGEVCVEATTEGPWAGVYTPMLGYWKQPEASRSALRDGVLHTGDLGLLDGAGNLFIKGRRGDLIIRGGANVYPAEVERILHEDARVAACAVVGAPDERLGRAGRGPRPGRPGRDPRRRHPSRALRRAAGALQGPGGVRLRRRLPPHPHGQDPQGRPRLLSTAASVARSGQKL